MLASFDHSWRSSVPFRWLFIFASFIGILAIPAGCLTIATVFHNPGLGIGILFIFGGVFVLLIPFSALKRGTFTAGRGSAISVYDRYRNPIGFWFYIFFYTFIGALIMAFAICLLIHPSLLNDSIKNHRPNKIAGNAGWPSQFRFAVHAG
jgi:hypothetical protein